MLGSIDFRVVKKRSFFSDIYGTVEKGGLVQVKCHLNYIYFKQGTERSRSSESIKNIWI